MNKWFNFIIHNYIKQLKTVASIGNYLQDLVVSKLIFASHNSCLAQSQMKL